MRNLFDEFKKFAIKGNAIDLAVGVVIGAAFGKIVSSLVSDLITPLLSPLTGRIDLSNLSWQISEDAVLNYGLFLNNIVEFLIIAFAIFMVIKQMNRLQAKEKPSSDTKTCPYCKSNIKKEAVRCPNCTSQLE
ncbi:MAG: large conductance mechanosensitive channel protein MscL [Candidatus Harrisonbacteria bacterium]|nr:large conductance mechanosensitive channel protein MscL [Candidatus Harrisonbacteria bacterium]